MRTLQRKAHEIDIAHTFEAVVGAAVGERHQVREQITTDLFRIHEMSHAEFLGQRLAFGVQIHADDLVGADEARTLNDIEADAAQTRTPRHWRPASTLAVLMTAPMPVVTPQPM